MARRPQQPRPPSIRRPLPLASIDSSLSLPDDNPFGLPPDAELFDLRDRENEEHRARQASIMHKSLVDRTLSALPPLHNCESQTGTTSAGPPQIAPPADEHQRRQQTSEFVDQKREIFLVQLLIDRKNREIYRIQNMRKTEKKNIIEDQAKIAEESNQYKMTANQYDTELQRAKQIMDKAIRRRTELGKEQKKKGSFVQLLESDIARKEEALESYRTCADFLKRLTPADLRPMEYFTSPEVLLLELENVENENLFLIRHCQELTDNQETGLRNVQGEIDQANAETADLLEAARRIPEVAEIQVTAGGVQSEGLDEELRALGRLVRSAYISCFNELSDVNTLARLAKLEQELERMYQASARIDPKFVSAKQQAKDKERRDRLRKEKAEKLEADQKKKLEQALERAQMPIKRRTGRPPVERTLPIRVNKNPVDENKKLAEEQQIDAFLYGPIGD
jgi:hypothetical protein